MRSLIGFMAALLITSGLLLVPAGASAASADETAAIAQQQAPQTPNAQVDIDVDRGGGAWYTSPVWIAVGIVVLLLIVLIATTAGRGGGTTVVKD